MNREQLLGEFETLMRTMPTREQFGNTDCSAWLGRALALIDRWDLSQGGKAHGAVGWLQNQDLESQIRGYGSLRTLLQQARAALQMDVGTLSTVVQQGQVFDYFDELRKVIEPARSALFFVDPYLDAEFVSRYLPHVAPGSAVRLLGGTKKMPTLLPAVDLFTKQSGLSVQVRSSNDIHDRYLFVDGAACYLSGASFKDGARNAPATLTQITDAFQAMWNTYDGLWKAGKVER
jgi:hypothetical protein